MKIIGVDVGGTFTDIIMTDRETGRQSVHKVPSTPDSQEKAVIRGIEEILQREKINVDEVGLVVHGTTVATNAMLERKGAKVCLVTTEGFEDILEIARQNREDIYDLYARKPDPLVTRENRIGIEERIDSEGNILRPLENMEIKRVIEELHQLSPDAVAISFMFSFKEPEHEKKLLTAVKKEINCYSVASADVLPEFREYERTSTTVLEAYLGPLVLGYLERLDKAVEQICPKSKLNIMQSNGGTILCSRVEGNAVGLAISGLAGGVIGGWDVSSSEGITHALTLDMGGTSCDISAVSERVLVKSDNEVAGLPLRTPSVDVKTIGAGGGSIAWIDDAGILHVGPQSAGADPGPAAYGKGGKQATVTDANLILGRLNPDFFLGGTIKLDMDSARQAIQRLASVLGRTNAETALGIIRISTSNMVQAIREVTVERGRDPRSFVLVPFGGAGPTQAVDIADDLDINSILVPPYPGITSALGLVCSNLRVDMMRTVMLQLDDHETEILFQLLKDLSLEASTRLVNQGVDPETIDEKWKIDMRYSGQSHELTIEGPSTSNDLVSKTRTLFEEEHQRSFGYKLEGKRVEWVTIRVTVTPKPEVRKTQTLDLQVSPENSRTRLVLLEDGTSTDAVVFKRNSIPLEKEIVGPAIIEQVDTTIYLSPKWRMERQINGNIWMRRVDS